MSSQQGRNQSIAKILLVIIGVISLVFRFRKMIHKSMIGENPTGFDWYMVTFWIIVLSLLTWELIRPKVKKNEIVKSLIVSKSTYRNKQNQATGPLAVSGLAFVMLVYNGYMIFFNHKEFGLDVIMWAVMLPLMLITWRVREHQLRKMEIGETS